MNDIPAKSVIVAKIFRAQCQVPGCNWWGADQPSYQDANVQRLAHLEDHRNGGRPELACPECPLCGQPPLYLFGEDQAWCGTPGCKAITWDASVSKAENLANAHYVNLSEGRGDG